MAKRPSGTYSLAMPSVFDYLDYRDLLKAHYDKCKAEETLFSYRLMAEQIGLDSSYLFRILQKDYHLPHQHVPRVLEILGLSGRPAEYFQMLIAYARARGQKAKQEILEKALALRDIGRRSLVENELALFRDWWVPTIRCLVEVVEGRANPMELAARIQPPISEEQAREAIDLLLEIGLLAKGSSGRLQLRDAHLSAGGPEKAAAVREYQGKVLMLARDALEAIPSSERDISTLTFAVDANAFGEIREMLRECRRQIQKRVDESPHPDRVIQLAIACFPLANTEGKR